MSKFLFLISLISVNAMAVTVADCPERVRVYVSGLNLSTEAGELVHMLQEDYGLQDVEVDALVSSFETVESIRNVARTLPKDIRRTKNGRCVYAKKDSIEKIELYTTKGQDRLMMQTDLGYRGILLRVYAKVDSVSPDAVEVKGNAGLALAVPRYPYESYDAGGRLHFIGNAKNVHLNVLE